MSKTLIIILVFVGAIFVLVSNRPETVFARSADGAVEVKGLSRSVRSVEIDSSKEFIPILENGVWLYYLITPVPAGVPFDAIMHVKVLEQWKQIEQDITEFTLYKWTEEDQQWKIIPTVVDLSKETLEARINLVESTWIAVGTILFNQ